MFPVTQLIAHCFLGNNEIHFMLETLIIDEICQFKSWRRTETAIFGIPRSLVFCLTSVFLKVRRMDIGLLYLQASIIFK